MELDLTKLEVLLEARYRRICNDVRGSFSDRKSRWIHGEWLSVCSSVGAERIREDCDFPAGGQADGYVFVGDPMPGGTWLKMSYDIAMRILVLGL